jgi:hypothetical protein
MMEGGYWRMIVVCLGFHELKLKRKRGVSGGVNIQMAKNEIFIPVLRRRKLVRGAFEG